MSMSEIKDEVLKLSLRDRVELNEVLWDSIQGDVEIGSDISVEEIQKRMEDFESGREKGIPAEVVFEKLEAKYGRM
jgi:putative addiction module component (TIGR02574 family)